MTEEKQQQLPHDSTVVLKRGRSDCIKLYKQWRNSNFADDNKIKLVIKTFYPQFQLIILQR